MNIKDLSPEEKAAFDSRLAVLTEEAKLNWDDPRWHQESAAVIRETLVKGFEHESLLDLLTDVSRVNPEDRVQVSEVRGLKVFQVARGGYIEESTLRQDVYEITRDNYGFHLSEMEDKMAANFGPEITRVIPLAQERLDAEFNLIVLRAFQAAVSPGDSNYLSTAGVDLDDINTAIRTVKNESMSDVTILGLPSMTEKIIDGLQTVNGGGFAGFLPETNEEIIRTGRVGRYRGCNIVELKNFKDDNEVPFFPGNELWVIGRDASKFAFWGGPKTKQFVEQDNWFWHYLLRQEFGGVVHRPERLFRLVDTTEDA